jgi:hypothetical protein
MRISSVVDCLVCLTTAPGVSLESSKPPISASSSAPGIQIKNGTLEGCLHALNGDVYRRVPFAAPAVDNLRLKRPFPY